MLYNPNVSLTLTGDGDLRAEYEARATAFDPTTWQSSHEHDLQRIAAEARQQSKYRKRINGSNEERVKDGQVEQEDCEPEDKTRRTEAPASIPMALGPDEAADK